MAGRTLQELVAAAAALHADRAAVTYDSGSPSEGPSSLSYRELAELSGKLSRALLKSCCPLAVGLYVSDDLLVPVWILGILQCAAAYVPLDPEAPGRLSAGVISQSGLKYCAVKTELLQKFQADLIKHVSVEVRAEWPEFKLTLTRLGPPLAEAECSGAETQNGASISERALAYVLHTSGTTGPPKTVRVPHQCIIPNILDLRSLFEMSADDVVFLASPLTFDPSVVDIFLALSSGAQLLIVPAIVKKIPGRLARVLFTDHKTTVLQVTPSLLLSFGERLLKRAVLSSGSPLRVLALGGEACPLPAQLSGWRQEGNRTRVYNIYGVTEVSCWACCYRIPDALLRTPNPTVPSVPLGAPLMDTKLEVRDEQGRAVSEGEGQLFIGGEDRVCLLDGEESVSPGTMRATGDWVSLQEGRLYYRGRRDREIKRNGKRLNLDSLQTLILTLPEVEACAVTLHQGARLLAFVVASPAGEKTAAASAPSSVRPPAGRSGPAPPEGPGPAAADGDGVRRMIRTQLALLLPSHCVPDALVLVPGLPLTPHGKADTAALIRIYQRQRERLESAKVDPSNAEQTLRGLWQDALGLAADAAFDEHSNFLLSGGDSLKALRLREDILAATAVTPHGLLEAILDGSFSDVLRHVTRTAPPSDGSADPPAGEARKRSAGPSNASPLAKREHRAEMRAVTVLRRAGEVTGTQASGPERPEAGLGLTVSWSSDTGRCVDASPVIVIQHGAEEGPDGATATAFIGSHSHRFQALDLLTGAIRWERVLGGRIEASAAVSHCGTLVIVGCYDGCVYFLCADSGQTRWAFSTGDAVKSCPAVDPLTGLVVAGSHDGHVYALDPQARRCVWRRHCGGGAVFSSPCVRPAQRRLYAASLGGRLLCLHLDSGEELWSYRRGVPFFSSPSCSGGGVVIGSVDGNICCVSDTGKLLWQFSTEGPVFSSPCLLPGQQRLLCGSHDGRLYCLDCSDGSLIWTFTTTGKVYSSPCALDGSALGRTGALAGLASTDGTVWILDARDGKQLASLALPGELFSSPVIWERSLVIGCRNDYVYSLNLTVG
ncbi:beta-alanine-activating enzyme [Menidia menidia]